MPEEEEEDCGNGNSERGDKRESHKIKQVEGERRDNSCEAGEEKCK